MSAKSYVFSMRSRNDLSLSMKGCLKSERTKNGRFSSPQNNLKDRDGA